MPHLPRIDALGVFRHVMIRGIEGRDILLDQSVYEDFLQRLESLIPQTHTRCYAWISLTELARNRQWGRATASI